MLRNAALSLAIASGLMVPLAQTAEAGVGGFAPPVALAANAPVDAAQYVYGRRNYC